MYSKLKFLGHPIHPMVVAFPIAFYTASFVGYLAYAWLGDPLWFRIALVSNVAGVLTALVAALPGLGDWIFAIPQGHSAKPVGFIHMLLNVTALALFALNAYLVWDQWNAALPDLKWSMALTLIGTLLTVAAGYFGYEMIQRHHVGVDLTPEQQRFEPIDPTRASSESAYRRA